MVRFQEARCAASMSSGTICFFLGSRSGSGLRTATSFGRHGSACVGFASLVGLDPPRDGRGMGRSVTPERVVVRDRPVVAERAARNAAAEELPTRDAGAGADKWRANISPIPCPPLVTTTHLPARSSSVNLQLGSGRGPHFGIRSYVMDRPVTLERGASLAWDGVAHQRRWAALDGNGSLDCG